MFASTHGDYAFNDRDTQSILKEVRDARSSGKEKIVFWNNAETFIVGLLHKVQRIAEILSDEIPKKDLIFSVGSPYGQEFYDQICIKNNWKNVITVLSCDHFEKGMVTQTYHVAKYMDRKYKIEPKEKLFTCFNRVHRKHRLELLAEAIRNNWLEKSYYSFEGAYPDWYNHKLPISQDDVKTIMTIKDQYPLRLNITEERNNPADIRPDDIFYYKNSYFSVIPETIMAPSSAGDVYNHMDALFLSEKIYKPIAFMHPFIVFGQPGILRYLRECGYKTFHPYINESYDDEPDYKLRFQTLISEIKRLEQLTPEQWSQWQKNIKPIVEYNAKYLSNASQRKSNNAIHIFE